MLCLHVIWLTVLKRWNGDDDDEHMKNQEDDAGVMDDNWVFENV